MRSPQPQHLRGNAFSPSQLCSTPGQGRVGGGESFRTRLLEFSEGDEGILEKLHLASELCGPQNQSPVPTLSQVSGTEPEGKTGPDRARARRNPKTFGDSFPKLFHRPFGAAPSLPSSSSRNPTHSACI